MLVFFLIKLLPYYSEIGLPVVYFALEYLLLLAIFGNWTSKCN